MRSSLHGSGALCGSATGWLPAYPASGATGSTAAVHEHVELLPFEFDSSPTGLRLQWEETEGASAQGVVLIEHVKAGGQAQRLGLAVGAELVRIDDVPVAGLDEARLAKLVANRPATFYFLPPQLPAKRILVHTFQE